MHSESFRHEPFPTTRWTLISQAAGVDEAQRSEALEKLCRIYWPPVFAFIVSKGAERVDAEDLTQSFFSEFLRRDDFCRVQSNRGNLRSFILKSVQNFVVNHHRDLSRQKRGGKTVHLSIDADGATVSGQAIELGDSETPEILFQRQWALSVLNRVVESLRARYERMGQGELFEALKFIITPSPSGPTYAKIGKDFGMKEGTVKVAVYRLRERYAAELRTAISETLGEGGDVEEELRELRSAL